MNIEKKIDIQIQHDFYQNMNDTLKIFRNKNQIKEIFEREQKHLNKNKMVFVGGGGLGKTHDMINYMSNSPRRKMTYFFSGRYSNDFLKDLSIINYLRAESKNKNVSIFIDALNEFDLVIAKKIIEIYEKSKCKFLITSRPLKLFENMKIKGYYNKFTTEEFILNKWNLSKKEKKIITNNSYSINFRTVNAIYSALSRGFRGMRNDDIDAWITGAYEEGVFYKNKKIWKKFKKYFKCIILNESVSNCFTNEEKEFLKEKNIIQQYEGGFYIPSDKALSGALFSREIYSTFLEKQKTNDPFSLVKNYLEWVNSIKNVTNLLELNQIILSGLKKNIEKTNMPKETFFEICVLFSYQYDWSKEKNKDHHEECDWKIDSNERLDALYSKYGDVEGIVLINLYDFPWYISTLNYKVSELPNNLNRPIDMSNTNLFPTIYSRWEFKKTWMMLYKNSYYSEISFLALINKDDIKITKTFISILECIDNEDKNYIINKIIINKRLAKYEILNIDQYNKGPNKPLFKTSEEMDEWIIKELDIDSVSKSSLMEVDLEDQFRDNERFDFKDFGPIDWTYEENYSLELILRYISSKSLLAAERLLTLIHNKRKDITTMLHNSTQSKYNIQWFDGSLLKKELPSVYNWYDSSKKILHIKRMSCWYGNEEIYFSKKGVKTPIKATIGINHEGGCLIKPKNIKSESTFWEYDINESKFKGREWKRWWQLPY